MGNRGCLHDSHGVIGKRRWTTKTWVSCLLEFGWWKRELMQPGSYTELFFLDEVTALAAGHRPCATCRREDYNRFLAACQMQKAGAINDLLHQERTQPLDYRPIVRGDGLPSGAIGTPDRGATLVLKWQDRFHQWTLEGYTGSEDHSRSVMRLVTPPTVAKAFATGYVPCVHPSAKVG